MTHEEMMKLVPGPSTDLIVAEALGDIVVSGDVVVPFSTSYDAAWRIVEHLRKRGWLVRVQEMPDGVPWLHNDKHEVYERSVCILYAMCVEGDDTGMRRITAYAETSCMAIVRALLMWKALYQPAKGTPALSPGGTHGHDRSEVQDSGGERDHQGAAHREGLGVVPRQG